MVTQSDPCVWSWSRCALAMEPRAIIRMDESGIHVVDSPATIGAKVK